jgi:hypothetical protein
VDFNDLGYMQVADFVAPGAQLEYFDATAGSWLRRRDFRLKFIQPQDYGGERLGRNLYGETEISTLSGAYLYTKIGAETGRLNTHVLRGGPALRLADRFSSYLYFETDGGKRVQYKLDANAAITAESRSAYLWGEPGMVWKLGDRLKAGLSVGYARGSQPNQYAGTATGAAAPVYVMGRLDQQILSSTLSVNMNFSPSLSLSYYGGPFAATGRYSEFQAVTDPRAADQAKRYAGLALQPAGDGALQGSYRGAPLRLAGPDFNWREFKSNLVLRWEYKAGSFLYCVWSQYRSDTADIGGFAPGSQYQRLFSAHPDNTFLIKLSYWFSI